MRQKANFWMALLLVLLVSLFLAILLIACGSAV